MEILNSKYVWAYLIWEPRYEPSCWLVRLQNGQSCLHGVIGTKTLCTLVYMRVGFINRMIFPLYIYIYVYTYIHMYIYVYIYLIDGLRICYNFLFVPIGKSKSKPRWARKETNYFWCFGLNMFCFFGFMIVYNQCKL